MGAVTATAPAEWLLAWTDWRGLFGLLTFAAFATAALIYFIVPEHESRPAESSAALSLRAVYADTRFWRVAPLSATCIGSSWAFQSLWAAPWLKDVDGFDQSSITSQLFMMALGIGIGALFLGTIADRLRKRGINAETLLAIVAGLFVSAQLALILRLPLPSVVPWLVISIVGAATVLSYATIADYFPAALAARANGALNLLHFGWAFIVQYGIGLVINQWSPIDGHYPVFAYSIAFGVCVAFQAAALVWFVLPWLHFRIAWLRSSFAPQPASGTSSLGSGIVPADGLVLVGDSAEW